MRVEFCCNHKSPCIQSWNESNFQDHKCHIYTYTCTIDVYFEKVIRLRMLGTFNQHLPLILLVQCYMEIASQSRPRFFGAISVLYVLTGKNPSICILLLCLVMITLTDGGCSWLLHYFFQAEPGLKAEVT